MDDFYALRFKPMWVYFKKEHFSFWMICGYLIIEYVRPQSIFPAIDFLPWAQVFLLGALAGWMADRKSKWVASPANKWMIAFLLVIIAATYTATYPDYSKKYFMNFFVWLVIYFSIVLVVNTRQRFYIFILIFLFASFKISFSEARIWASRGFSFTSWGLQGPPGYFTNSGELAIQMLVYAPVAYHLYLFISPWLVRWKKIMMILMPFTAGMTVIGASSRGGQIGMVVQIYQLFLKGRLSIKSIAITAAIVGLVYYAIPEQQKLRFASTGKDKTSEQRLLYWKHGREMIQEDPFLGVGYFNFIPYYEAHFADDLLYDHAELPHNIFIQIGTDAGYLGLGVYLMLIYQQFALNRETRKQSTKLKKDGALFLSLAKGLDIGMCGFLIAGQFVTVGYYPFMWINLAFAAALRNVCLKEVAQQETKAT
jgi:O-antigen ligase